MPLPWMPPAVAIQVRWNTVGWICVHALALQKKEGATRTIYSDSRTAIIWVSKKHCKTTLPRTPENAYLYNVIARAEQWLRVNSYPNKLLKWETERWGEVPADFGRK